jgi:hypothetical protein
MGIINLPNQQIQPIAGKPGSGSAIEKGQRMKNVATVIIGLLAMTALANEPQHPYLRLDTEFRLVEKGSVLDCSMSLVDSNTVQSISSAGLTQGGGRIAPDGFRVRFSRPMKSIGVQHIGPVDVNILGKTVKTDRLTVKVVEKFNIDEMFIAISSADDVRVEQEVRITVEWFVRQNEDETASQSEPNPNLSIPDAEVSLTPGKQSGSVIQVGTQAYTHWCWGYTILPKKAGTLVMNKDSFKGLAGKTANEVQVQVR